MSGTRDLWPRLGKILSEVNRNKIRLLMHMNDSFMRREDLYEYWKRNREKKLPTSLDASIVNLGLIDID